MAFVSPLNTISSLTLSIYQLHLALLTDCYHEKMSRGKESRGNNKNEATSHEKGSHMYHTKKEVTSLEYIYHVDISLNNKCSNFSHFWTGVYICGI